MADEKKQDPNVLGLSIELQLNALNANQALMDFGNKATELSEQISQSFKTAFDSVATFISDLNTKSEPLIKSYDTLATNLTGVTTSLTKFDAIVGQSYDNLTSAVAGITTSLGGFEKLVEKPYDNLNSAVAGMTTSLEGFEKLVEKPYDNLNTALAGVTTALTAFEAAAQKLAEGYKAPTDAVNELIFKQTQFNANVSVLSVQALTELKRAYTELADVQTKMIEEMVTYLDDKFKDYHTKSEEIKGFQEDTYKFVKDANPISKAMADNFIKIADAGPDMMAAFKDAADYLTDDNTGVQKMLTTFNAISAAIQAKNLHHKAELDMVEKEGLSLKNLLNAGQKKEEQEKRNRIQLDAQRRLYGAILATVREIDDVAERFHKANYRSTGSMYDLAGATAQVALQSGMANKEAGEMVAELLHVQTPKAEYAKLATSMVQIERMTGLGAKSLASYSRTLRNLGIPAMDISKRIKTLAADMGRFRIESEDAAVIIEIMNEKYINLGKTLSEKNLTTLQAVTAADLSLAKAHGISTAAVKKYSDTTFETLIALQAATGRYIETIEDQQRAHMDLGLIIHQRLQAAGNDIQSQARMMMVLQAQYNLTGEEVRLFAEKGKLLQKFGIDPDAPNALELYQKALAETAPLADQFGASMATVGKQLAMLWTKFSGVIAYFVIPILEAMAAILNVVNILVDGFTTKYEDLDEAMASATGKVSDFTLGIMYLARSISFLLTAMTHIPEVLADIWMFLEETVPVLGFFMLGIREIGILIQTIGRICGVTGDTMGWMFKLIIGSIILIATLGPTLLGVFVGLGWAFPAIFKGILLAGKAVAKAVGYIGKALLDFVKELASVSWGAILKLAGLAVVVVILAVAFLILANALKIIGSIPFEGLSQGLVVLGLALVFCAAMLAIAGAITTVASPVIITLAVIFAGLALVAVALAYALSICSDSLVTLSEILTGEFCGYVALLGLNLTVLAAGMILFAAASILFVPAAALFAIGSLIFAGAAKLVGWATTALAENMEKLSKAMSPGLGSWLAEVGAGLGLMLSKIGTGIQLAAVGTAMLPLANGLSQIGAAFAAAGPTLGASFKSFVEGLAAFTNVDKGIAETMKAIGLPLMILAGGIAAIAMSMAGTDESFGMKFKAVAEGIAAVVTAFGGIDKSALDLMTQLTVPLTALGQAIASLSTTFAGVDPAFTEKFKLVATDIGAGISAFKDIDVGVADVIVAISAALSQFSTAVVMLQQTFGSLDIGFIENIKTVALGLSSIAGTLAQTALPLIFGASGLAQGAAFLGMAATAIDAAVTALSTSVGILSEISTSLLDSTTNINTAGRLMSTGALSLIYGGYLLAKASPALYVAAKDVIMSAGVLSLAGYILLNFSTVIKTSGEAALVGAKSLVATGEELLRASEGLKKAGPALNEALTQFKDVLPTLKSVGDQLGPAASTLMVGSYKILMSSMFLGIAINAIATHMAKLTSFVDPIERLAGAFERLSASMLSMKNSVANLAELPLEAIIQSFQKFSPTEEALTKIERLSIALEKIGKEYAKSIENETQIAAELTTGKVTTSTNTPQEKKEDPGIKTNQILHDSKDTLEKILEAVMPSDQPKFTNFGSGMFNSSRGFEI